MAGGSRRGIHSFRRKVRTPARVSVLPNENERLMARIDALSRGARNNWLGLMAFLAFVGLTIVEFEDADFLVGRRRTELPLINVDISTLGFLLITPFLVTTLHSNLHYHLMQLWREIGQAPHAIDRKPLGQRIFPWLINDIALSARSDCRDWRNPFFYFFKVVGLLLTFTATPTLLAFLWWRSMVGHNVVLTSLIGFCLIVATSLSIGSAFILKNIGGNNNRGANLLKRVAIALIPTVAMVSVFFVGASRSSFGDQFLNVRFWKVATANLENLELVDKPPDWRNHKEARLLFRDKWCDRKNIPAQFCAELGDVNEIKKHDYYQYHEAWCEEYLPSVLFPQTIDDIKEGNSIDKAIREMDGPCVLLLYRLNTQFSGDWHLERQEQIRRLPYVDLRGIDLQGGKS